METYVSSLSKGNINSNNAVSIAQNKINSAIKQLHNVIDSFEEDKTVQRYATIEYDGKFTLQPFIVERNPEKPVEIVAKIGDETMWIGTISENGIVSIGMNDFTTNDSGETVKIVSSKDYSGQCFWMNNVYDPNEQPTDYYYEHNGEPYNKEYFIDGVRYVKSGNIKRIDTIEMYDYWWDTGYGHEPYWRCTAKEKTYEQDTYSLFIDYSNGNMHIYQKYLSNDIA